LHTIDYDKALWRSAAKLTASQAILDGLWTDLAAHAQVARPGQVALRETVAMAATARWATAAALKRDESRGMHMRIDAPLTKPERARRLLTGGLDRIWTRFDIAPRDAEVEIAA
jgi:succinate dehydrogenase/fumarate reductase flavoprotein subunit